MAEVKLDLPLAALAGPIGDIVNALTTEQKEAIALSVVKQIMEDPAQDRHNSEADKRAIEQTRSDNYYLRSESDDKVRAHVDYRRRMDATFQGPRGEIIKLMMQTAQSTAAEAITKLVNESDVTKATLEVVGRLIKERMPDMIANAMMLHMADNLHRVVTQQLQVGVGPTDGNHPAPITSVMLQSLVSDVATEMARKRLVGG